MSSDWEEMSSPRAIVCKREINCDQGGATVQMVCLADGFLLDCGSGGFALERARRLATIINSADPTAFTQEALSGPCPF